jgi:hypothetical protein
LGGFGGFLAESYPALTINPENALADPEGAMSWGGSIGSVSGQTVLMTPTLSGNQFEPGFSTTSGAGIGQGPWAGGGQSGFSGGITPHSLSGLGPLGTGGFNGGFDGIGGFGVPTGFGIPTSSICPDGVTFPDPQGNCPQSIFPFTSSLLQPNIDVVGPMVDFHHRRHNFGFNPVFPIGAVDPFAESFNQFGFPGPEPFGSPFGYPGISPFGPEPFGGPLGIPPFESPYGIPSPFAESPFFPQPSPFFPPSPFLQPEYPGIPQSPFFPPPEPFGEPFPPQQSPFFPEPEFPPEPFLGGAPGAPGLGGAGGGGGGGGLGGLGGAGGLGGGFF